MRALLAGLFVFVGLLAAASVAFAVLPKNFPPALTGILLAVVALGLCWFCLAFFNRSRAQTTDTLEDLRQKGLLVSELFEATRAFEVEEFEDEGEQYFIELKNGSVLFLCGQYLDDCTPAFPSTKFTLLRYKDTRDVVAVVCEGDALESEFVAPHFDESDFASNRVPEDGEMISDRTYDQLKAEHLGRKKR